jgi:hypothetical protein
MEKALSVIQKGSEKIDSEHNALIPASVVCIGDALIALAAGPIGMHSIGELVTLLDCCAVELVWLRIQSGEPTFPLLHPRLFPHKRWLLTS